MASEKPTTSKKIIDVSHPDETVPDTSSRPVIVTNRPMIKQDPMIAEKAAEEPEKSDESKPTKAASKTKEEPAATKKKSIAPLADEKIVIEPIESDEAKDDQPAEEPEEVTASDKTEETVEESAKPSDQSKEKEPKESQAADENVQVDEDATEKAKKEEEIDQAELDRQADLQKLIDSGKYALPIVDAHSRRYVLGLVLLLIVLAALVLNVILDIGLIQLPGIPHTTFFSVK